MSLPDEMFWVCLVGRRPRARPRTRWSGYISRLACEHLGILPEELVGVAKEKVIWPSLLKLLPLRPRPGYAKNYKDKEFPLSTLRSQFLTSAA